MERPKQIAMQTQRIAVLLVSSLTLVHLAIVSGIVKKCQVELLELPAGFRLSDLLEGAVGLVLAQAYNFLFSCTNANAKFSQLHALFNGLMVLAQGGHMMVNPLDDWFASLQVPAEHYRTIYWQHEYVCHRVSAIGIFGMLALSASCSPLSSTSPPDWTILSIAGLHGTALGFLGIGTRTVLVTLPFCIFISFNWIRRSDAGLVAMHAATVAGATLIIQGFWFLKNKGSLPTFDDLRIDSASPHAQVTTALSQGSNRIVWGAPIFLVLTVTLMRAMVWSVVRRAVAITKTNVE